jgi:hypothetical protein
VIAACRGAIEVSKMTTSQVGSLPTTMLGRASGTYNIAAELFDGNMARFRIGEM